LFGARLDLDYALNPLVVEAERGDSTTEAGSLVEHQLSAHLNFSLGLFERLVVFAGLPINLVQSGTSFGVLPAGDGAGLGDLFLGARGRIYGEPGDVFALGVQLAVSFPTAGAANAAQRYSGERGVTFAPTLLLEVRPHEVLRITGNLGGRFRTDAPAEVVNLAVGQEITWGLGLTVEAVRDLLRLYLEGYGSASFESSAREAVPFEVLAGARVEPVRGLEVGAALGTGLSRGFGSPDFRGVLTVGYAQRPIRETIGDRDGDGLLDNVDRCPDEPEDRDSFQDEDGCPDPDNDQDGILDTADQCPMEPEDRDGFEDENGCPDPDNDQDGILDRNDRCPNEPGVPENQGCPAVAQIREETGQIITLGRIEFQTDSDVLLQTSIPIVENVRDVLRDHPEITLVRIEGHTDDRAADDYNMDLSRRRARAVVLWLAGHGIAPGRMEAYGCGEIHPVQPNGTEEGRQANRRVEFHIMQPAHHAQSRPNRRGCQSIPLN
jgi:outer membrane protein OmpA-like peptidoglycan-associated protein